MKTGLQTSNCGRNTIALILLLLVCGGYTVADGTERKALQGLCGGVSVDENGLLRISELEHTLKSNSHISGILLMAKWNTIEPQKGEFRWDNLDQAVALVRQHNRYYKLKIQPGTSTPDWVYEGGAVPFLTKGSNPYRESTYKKTLKVPIPWDEHYLQQFDDLVSAIGKRYSEDPYCAGVVITGANYQSGETHLPKEPEDRENWEQLKYKEYLPAAYDRIVDIWAAAFPRQQICLHASVIIHRDDGILERVIERAAQAYPDRFTLQNCQLSGKRDNMSLYSYGLINRYVGRLHVGYQSLALLGSERQGDTQVSIYNYIRGKGEYWELWKGNSTDAGFCEYLIGEISRARGMGADAYRSELEAAGKNFE